MLGQIKDFRITHTGQIKSGRIESRRSGLAALCFQDFSHPVHASCTRADINQTADNIANHVVKEGICLNADLDKPSETGYMKIFDIFYRRLTLAARGSET